MLKSLGLLWGCLLLLGALHAQQIAPSGSAFGVTLGFRQLTLRDEAASAVTYRGNLPTFGLNWTNNTSNLLWEANLQSSYGKFFPKNFPDREIIFLDRNLDGSIDTVRVQANGTQLMLSGNFGFYKKQSLNRGDDSFWAYGARISEDLNYPQGFVSPGLNNVVSLSPQVLAGIGNPEKGMFTVGIVVPIASLVTRLPYNQTISQPDGPSAAKSFLKYNTEFRSLNKHREMKLRLGYQHRLSNRLIGGLHYEFSWMKDTDPRPLLVRTNALAATLGFY